MAETAPDGTSILVIDEDGHVTHYNTRKEANAAIRGVLGLVGSVIHPTNNHPALVYLHDRATDSTEPFCVSQRAADEVGLVVRSFAAAEANATWKLRGRVVEAYHAGGGTLSGDKGAFLFCASAIANGKCHWPDCGFDLDVDKTVKRCYGVYVCRLGHRQFGPLFGLMRFGDPPPCDCEACRGPNLEPVERSVHGIRMAVDTQDRTDNTAAELEGEPP